MGGPIIKNRKFFFGSWQSTRELNAAPQVASVPTPAMRQGMFSKKITDPVTKAAFPNNTIPQDRWDPVSAKLLTPYPLPNLPGEVRNFGPLGNSNYHALLAKLERRFSKGPTLLASDTYGHSIDNGKSQSGLSSILRARFSWP